MSHFIPTYLRQQLQNDPSYVSNVDLITVGHAAFATGDIELATAASYELKNRLYDLSEWEYSIDPKTINQIASNSQHGIFTRTKDRALHTNNPDPSVLFAKLSTIIQAVPDCQELKDCKILAIGEWKLEYWSDPGSSIATSLDNRWSIGKGIELESDVPVALIRCEGVDPDLDSFMLKSCETDGAGKLSNRFRFGVLQDKRIFDFEMAKSIANTLVNREDGSSTGNKVTVVGLQRFVGSRPRCHDPRTEEGAKTQV